MPSVTSVIIPSPIRYIARTIELNPESVYVSDTFDASMSPGIGFSIAHISEKPGEFVFVDVYYQNSYDGIVFRDVEMVSIVNGGQDFRVYIPTRPYWRFVVVNTSGRKAAVDAVIALLPSGTPPPVVPHA